MTLNKLRLQANEKGFTLIELMIVIAIIGILAAIAIPNFISYRNKAFCSGAESDANAIIASLSDYFSIPSHQTGLSGSIAADGTGVTGLVLPALSNRNTAALTTATSATGNLQHTVVVTDFSTRCPLSYRTSQAGAGWSTSANTFTKSML
ncbi:prepilin-type N-terminal cleavage/methylation domain-containing protein [Desulfobulbus sp.]|uniref:prepilin-type N-terminal cleavage/methylation domain-containing protein n=1 Tax=Desulfobulbus sp. TaxID=895 RepID=UPI0027B99EBA|nr:prepilin-type N-terminal cleavage/methylation domain-containing protein [Desulfobulbus sp.]